MVVMVMVLVVLVLLGIIKIMHFVFKSLIS